MTKKEGLCRRGAIPRARICGVDARETMASSQDGQSRRRAMTSSRGLQCFNAILLLNIILLAAAVPSPSSALHSPEPSRCRHGEMRQAAEPQRGGHLKRHSQSILRGGGAVGGGGQGNAESASEAAACLPRMRPSRVPSMMMRSWSQRSLISSTTPAPEGESISNNNNNNNNNNNDASTGAGTQPEKLGVSPAGSGKKMAYWQLIRKALDLAWPSGHAGLQARVFLSLALIAWSRFTNMMIPQLYKAAVDDLSLPQGTSPVDPGKRGALWYICAYVATKAFVGLQGDVKSLIFTPVAQYVKRHVQLTVFDHLHSLSHRYHLGRKTGTVMQEMERGAGSLLRLVELVAFRVVPSLLDIGVCIAVFLASGRMKLAGITMVTIVLYLTTTAVVTEWRNSFRKNMVDAESRTKGRAVESLLNFETVKYFGAARHESTEYNRRMLEEQKAEMASERSLVLLNGLQQLIICGGLFASMMESALRVRSGQSSLGDFVMVNSYFLQLYAPLTWMGTIYRMIQQAFVDMERMLALLDEKVDIKDAPDAEPLAADGHGRVTFEGVSLAYDDDNYVLRNVTFEAGPGSKVALVGSSGAGKSSVGKLLCRLYDPTEGRVMIDGKDIKLTTLDSLRDTVGVVPQDCALFQDSIRYNIAYGRYTGAPASEPEVESACRSAMIHDKISSFPNGYQTLVGERGMRLSGGERQRVAVARVLLKSPKVLLLDEATSALDSETEGKIQASLESACLGRTTLVIAHRLSTIVDSDLILVMENGEIVERGRHGELVELGGRYAAMWAKQNSNRTAATSGASATLDHVPTAASTAEGDVEDDKTAVPSSGKPSPSPDGAPPKILRGGGGGGPVRVLSVRGGGDDAGAAAGKLAWIKSIGPMDGSRGGEEVMAMYKTADSCCFPEVVSSAAVHPPSYPRPVMHEHVRGRLAAEDGRFLLAGFSGAVDNIDHHGEIKPDAGACVYMRSPHVLVGGDRVAYIELLVGKGQDGKERAGALLKEAEGQAKEEGCTSMRVFVSGSARVLLTWLAQRGYLPVQRLRRWDGERSQNSQGEAIGPQEEAWMLLGSQHFPKESSGGVCGDVLWEMDKPLVSGEDADGEGPKDCSKEMSHVLDKEAWEDATVLRPLVRDERDATRQAKQAMWRPPVNGSLNIASFQKPSFQGFSLKHGASTPWNIGQETVAHQVTLDWAMGRSSWGRTLERRGILHRRDASLAARAQSHAAGSASVVQKGKQATLDCFFKVRSGEDGSNGVQEQHGEAGIDHHPGDGRQSGHAVDNVEPGEGLLAGRPAPVPSDPVASAPESQTAADMMVDAAAD